MAEVSFMAKFPDRDGVPDSEPHSYKLRYYVQASKQKEAGSGRRMKDVNYTLLDNYGEEVATGTFVMGATWVSSSAVVIRKAAEDSGLVVKGTTRTFQNRWFGS